MLNLFRTQYKSVLICITSLLFVFVSSQGNTEEITTIKAAELACHRVDRLVVLKKIDADFISKFEKLELVEVTPDSTGVRFEVTVYQSHPLNGSPNSLSIWLDGSGKVLKHTVNAGGFSNPEFEWPEKDPVTLAETGLHYVLDEHLENQQLRPFALDFMSLSLTQKKTSQNTLAEMTIKSRTTSSKLILVMDLNGKLIKKSIVP